MGMVKEGANKFGMQYGTTVGGRKHAYADLSRNVASLWGKTKYWGLKGTWMGELETA